MVPMVTGFKALFCVLSWAGQGHPFQPLQQSRRRPWSKIQRTLCPLNGRPPPATSQDRLCLRLYVTFYNLKGTKPTILTGLPRVAHFIRPSPFPEESNVFGQHPREKHGGFHTPARTTLKQDSGENVEMASQDDGTVAERGSDILQRERERGGSLEKWHSLW